MRKMTTKQLRWKYIFGLLRNLLFFKIGLGLVLNGFSLIYIAIIYSTIKCQTKTRLNKLSSAICAWIWTHESLPCPAMKKKVWIQDGKNPSVPWDQTIFCLHKCILMVCVVANWNVLRVISTILFSILPT